MEEAIKEFIKSPYNVNNVIYDIYESFGKIMEEQCPTCPHRDAYNYFMTGACPTFAQILHTIFEGFAEYYDTDGHILNKIGNYFYDIAYWKIKLCSEHPEYRYCPDELFGMATIALGKHDGTEEKIKEPLIEVGKESLKRNLEELGLIGKTL